MQPFLIGFFRLGEAPLVLVEIAEALVGRGQIRVQAEGLVIDDLGRIQITPMAVETAQRVEIVLLVRREAGGLPARS